MANDQYRLLGTYAFTNGAHLSHPETGFLCLDLRSNRQQLTPIRGSGAELLTLDFEQAVYGAQPYESAAITLTVDNDSEDNPLFLIVSPRDGQLVASLEWRLGEDALLRVQLVSTDRVGTGGLTISVSGTPTAPGVIFHPLVETFVLDPIPKDARRGGLRPPFAFNPAHADPSPKALPWPGLSVSASVRRQLRASRDAPRGSRRGADRGPRGAAHPEAGISCHAGGRDPLDGS